MRKKWSTLRTQFRRELKKQIALRQANPTAVNAPTPWKYFVPLLFLRGQILKKKTVLTSEIYDDQENMDFELEDSPYNEYLTELDILETAYQEPADAEVSMSAPFLMNANHMQFSTDILLDAQPSEPKNTTSLTELLENFQKEIISLERDKMNTVDLSKTDDDLLYLHSLLPYFKSLDKVKKFVLRTRIQQLVCDFIANEKSNLSDHSYSVRK